MFKVKNKLNGKICSVYKVETYDDEGISFLSHNGYEWVWLDAIDYVPIDIPKLDVSKANNEYIKVSEIDDTEVDVLVNTKWFTVSSSEVNQFANKIKELIDSYKVW